MQATEGFRKAFKKEESIFCNIPSSKTPGLNLVSGSALKKSRFFAVTMEGTKSDRSASSISNLDCINRTVFDPNDFPVRVRPNHVMECCLMVGIISTSPKKLLAEWRREKAQIMQSASYGRDAWRCNKVNHIFLRCVDAS